MIHTYPRDITSFREEGKKIRNKVKNDTNINKQHTFGNSKSQDYSIITFNENHYDNEKDLWFLCDNCLVPIKPCKIV